MTTITNVKFSLQVVIRFVTCVLLVSLIVLIYFRYVHVNPTTVALSFLLAILAVAAVWGLVYAIPMSIAAALCFNFFFLPPILRFTIADTQNWVALVAFLATSIIASNLSERARRETLAATERRIEVERLYTLSEQLMISDNVVELLKSVPFYIAETFGVEHAAIHIAEKDKIYRSGPEAESLLNSELREVFAQGEIVLEPKQNRCFVPLRMGVRRMGSLGMAGDVLSRETLEALGGLVAIAIERAGAVETLMRSEASRESERLRSALLDSITHEFRTPLTSIKAAITSLRSSGNMMEEERQDLLAVIEEETDRLNRLVGEAVEMAQLDAHEVRLDLAPHQISEAITPALQDSKSVIADHLIHMRLADDLPPAMMDLVWIKKVLQHLIENAAKYSAPHAPIFISSELRNGRLITSIADRGIGIDDLERSMIFDKFYRGQGQRYRVQGSGMGLAIVKAIVEAHQGRIEVTSQLGQGSVFSFELPLTDRQ